MHPTRRRSCRRYIVRFTSLTDVKEYAVWIDQHGKLDRTGGETYGGHIVMLLGRDVHDSHLVELASNGISYIVSDEIQIDLDLCLEMLSLKFGIHRLLLEGGAHTNAALLKAKLVDEISLLLLMIGGTRKAGRYLRLTPEMGSISGKLNVRLGVR